MQHSEIDKRERILAAAFQTFVTYGFRKTSMDDIARAADMSRPALYQLFRNKNDIFRGLVATLLEQAAAQARQELATDKPFRDRLFHAMDRSIIDMHRQIDATPHGQELIGINDEIAPDIELQWCDTMASVIADGLRQAESRGEILLLSLDADANAALFMQAMEGIKQHYLRGEDVEPHIRNLVDFVADALQASRR